MHFFAICWFVSILNIAHATESETCEDNDGREHTIVHIAFYLWYGNPDVDGRWIHWNHKVLPHWNPSIDKQHEKFNWNPPDEPHAPFRPLKGLYSSSDAATLRTQFIEIANAGIDSAMISWWGRSDWEGKRDDMGVSTDPLIPLVLDAAETAGLYITFHIEPYGGRTAKTFHDDLFYIYARYGNHPALWREGPNQLPVFFLYDVSAVHSGEDAASWSETLARVRNTVHDALFFCLWIGNGKDLQFVQDAGFDGAYTYFAAAGFTKGSIPEKWSNIQEELTSIGKLFIPAVGPGYDDTLIRPWNKMNVRSRNHGNYYDAMWKSAINSNPHAISITSYNEWGEGTQIEPAIQYTSNGGRIYKDYEPNDPFFYLNQTQKWIDKYTSTKNKHDID